jgi:hypothetical protein
VISITFRTPFYALLALRTRFREIDKLGCYARMPTFGAFCLDETPCILFKIVRITFPSKSNKDSKLDLLDNPIFFKNGRNNLKTRWVIKKGGRINSNTRRIIARSGWIIFLTTSSLFPYSQNGVW